MSDKASSISSYSAAELMQYATGRMPPAQMHALEKAAMEDPFLAEAIDGYREAVATQPAATVQAQAVRLNQLKGEIKAKVIPLWQRKSVRIAVAALFIAGAGWTIFSLLQKPATPATAIVQQLPAVPPQLDTNDAAVAIASKAAPQPLVIDSNLAATALSLNKEELAPATGTLAKEEASETNPGVSATPNSPELADLQKMDTLSPGNATTMVKPAPSESRLAMRRMQTLEHVFQAQITDARNNPVPYANVMIEGQDFGTYSDVSGRFNFISDDSVLHIRVRSVGYSAQSLELPNESGRPPIRIVLQEDHLFAKNLPLTVQGRSVPTNPVKKNIIERDSIVGQETVNGNIPFYEQYLLNNNRISLLPTLNRQVQLSFDVSETGEPVNITITKSSGGKALDEEAIRLVKEGPKLKANTAKGRKKVTVRF